MTVLLFVVTIIAFLGVDYFVRRSKHAPAMAHPRRVPAFRFPEGIFFTRTHTWLNLFPSGKVQLGIDDFVTRMFNAPSVTLLKKDGEPVAVGDPIIRLQEGTSEVVLRSPIDGMVMQRNSRLTSRPDVMTEDLFLTGWAYTMQPAKSMDIRSFILGADTAKWLASELRRLRDFIVTTHAATDTGALALQDGGEPMPGMLCGLKPEHCKLFEEEFLTVRAAQ